MSEAARLAEALATVAPPAHPQQSADRHVATEPKPAPTRGTPTPAPALSNPPPPWLVELAAGHQGDLVPLTGTGKQVEWAGRLRATRLTAVRLRAPELVPVLTIISDSTWWIASDKTPLAEIRWASPEQVTTPGATPARQRGDDDGDSPPTSRRPSLTSSAKTDPSWSATP